MDNTPAPAAPAALAPAQRPPVHRGVFIVLFGIVLPVVTSLVELATHMCAESFFDPLPTLGHVFAVFLVPLAGAASLRVLWRRDGDRLEATIFAQAAAMAISAVYALIFAPLTPLALFAIPYMGMGILPLAPALSFIAGLRALLALRRLRIALGRPARRRVVWPGLAAGVGLMIALQIPATATRLLVAAAASDDADTSRAGIRWLRRIGSRDLMLRACYQRPTGATDVLGALLNITVPVPPEKMRDIYFRVTGRPFDTEPQPLLGGGGGGRSSRREWDVEQGSDRVGVVPMRGLTLAGSRIDGSIDARAALGYVEWTFELANAAPVQREARAEIVLPSGGVVSRVTLWVDGVEREATFAGRDVTRRAYERVVRRQRDPILVTTSAPDRVLVQCFPVAPNGGRMKARIGVTAPLQLATRASGTLVLPYFAQRNFSVPAGVTHSIVIDSKDRFLTQAAPAVAEPQSPAPFAHVVVERPADTDRAWTSDRTPEGPASPAAIVTQTLRSERVAAPSRLVIVVDGSAAMKEAAEAVAAALSALPSNVPVAITIAGDDVVPFAGQAAAIAGLDFAGGTDSLPALVAAWDLAAAEPRAAVLWIHGPQPVLLASPEPLRQRIERRRDGPPIYTFAAAGGENRLLAALGDEAGVETVPRLSDTASDLGRFLGALDGKWERIVAVRARETGAPPAAAADGAQTSDHLARLWAHERIVALARGAPGKPPTPADRKEALALAARYQLVTPVSGAVVLETRAQYDAAGLAPADGSEVPTVPEPGTWALILALALALLIARRRMVGARRAL
jgi:hypothetical protein